MKRKYINKTKTKKQTNEVQKIERQITKLQKQVGAGFQWISIYLPLELTNMQSPLNKVNLMDFSNMVPCFGTDGSDLQSNKWYHSSFDFDIELTYGNELANVNVDIFLVRCKETSAPNINFSTGALTLSTPNDYIYNSAGIGEVRQVYLNPKLFDVLWSKHFQVGNNNQAITTASIPSYRNEGLVTLYRGRKKIKTGHTIIAPEGSVGSLHCSTNPAHNYYLLMFNNNSAADLEYPYVRAMFNHHIKSPT